MTQPSVTAPAPSTNLWSKLIIGLTLAAVVGFLLWTSSSSNDRFFRKPGHETDYFNMLARGFRKGTLSLDAEVPQALLKLDDPYDPVKRNGLGIHDASYYKGKYYLYFGPAPVLTLFVPWHLLTGTDISMSWATFGYAAAGYLVLAMILLAVWRRYFSAAGLPAIVPALLVLGLCTMVPSALRRSSIWEMPIAAGFFHATLAFAAVYAAMHGRRRTLWFTLSGLAVGLAVASRPVYVAAVALPACALAWLWWDGRRRGDWQWWPGRAWWHPANGCGAALASAAALLMVYNHLRFENPLEFGMKYQLTSAYQSKITPFSLSYWWHDVRVYFLNPAKWSATYPYVLPGDPPRPAPQGYLYEEWVYAVLPNLPIFVVTFAAAFAFWRRREQPLAGWLLGMSVTAFILANLLSCFVSTADRYMVDFLPAWALLAGVGLLWLDSALREKVALRVAALIACCGAAAVSIFVGVLASIESQGVLPRENPRLYRRVTQLVTSPAAWLESQKVAPSELRLRHGGLARGWAAEMEFTVDATTRTWNGRSFPVLVAGRHQVADTIVLDVTKEGKWRFGYDHWGDPRRLSPEFDEPEAGVFRFQIRYSEIEEKPREVPQRWLTITVDGQELWRARVPFHPGLADRLRVGENRIGASTCETSFPAEIRSRIIP